MIFLKEKLLNDTFDNFMEIGFSDSLPLNMLDEIVTEDVMGFGTTIDEKIFSLSGFKELLERQREQSKGMQLQSKINPLLHRISADTNSAVFTDDLILTITAGDETMEIHLRFSTVLEFRNEKWLVVHWHASKPENVQSEEDTFGIDEWKQRNAELEKLVNEKTAELQRSLSELKATQSQLIHAEKMASLGELTAGIAHEIQNPLNFVNNFSEVNKELITELKVEIEKGDLEEVIAIANDIESNEEKINHHGKRADAIVKGMLQHSQNSKGQKEPADLNALADEYLRLAYHGIRAKDNSYNATLLTDFDNSIGSINIVPQDMGRVILNLINNAFYAVGQKKKKNLNGYEPFVSVSTKKRTIMLLMIVQDNGNGIPQSIIDKIFQPFFTTKPTGQGTGLGLSLAYDIVKAHGGELKVETKEGEGTIFQILLPNV